MNVERCGFCKSLSHAVLVCCECEDTPTKMRFYVSCPNCQACTGCYSTREEATKAWNDVMCLCPKHPMIIESCFDKEPSKKKEIQ